MPSRFLNNITVNDSYTLPSADGDADQIIQTDGAGNLSFVDLSSIEGAASNFVYFEVKNETGSPINKGKGVMAVGTDGNSGHILIDEMIADGSVEPKYFLGVLETTVANGGFARVISFGQLDQFDTRGQNGETWLDGQILWCDPDSAGDFTITEPDGPNVKIAAAFILNSSTNGKIQVRVQANEGIHDLHDTKITSQVDGDVLVWDNTTGVWFNDSTLNIDYTAGNVGIGTTSPSTKLHISDATTPEVRIQDTTNNRYLSLYQNDSNSYIQTSLNSPLVFSTHGSNERMRITTSGNVGIGTTSPTNKLQVTGGSVGVDSEYMVRDNRNNTILLQSASTAASNRSLTIGNATYSNIIVPNGNVGIGTTSPSEKLHVRGGNIRIDSNNTGGQNLQFRNNGVANALLSNTANILGGSSSSTDFNTYVYGNNPYSVWTNNVNRLTVDGTGNVGIGTTSPSHKLTINASNDTTALGIDFPSAHFDFSANSTSGYTSNFRINDVGMDIGHDSTARSLNLQTGNQDRLTILGNGNVGIGTTSPAYPLEVNGIIKTSSSFLGTTAIIQKVTALNANGIQFTNNGGSEKMRITDAGNVGIGTTNPSSKLHSVTTATGPIDYTQRAAILGINDSTDITYANSVGVAGQVRTSGGYAIYGDTYGAGGWAGYFDGKGYFSGNVGIGTTSPSHKLQVNGTIGIRNSMTSQPTYGYANVGAGDFVVGGNSVYPGVITLYNQDTTISAGQDLGVIQFVGKSDTSTGYTSSMIKGSTQLAAGSGNSGGGILSFLTTSGYGSLSEKMRIDHIGNVGIGTTSPNEKLEVNGSVRVTGAGLDVGYGNNSNNFVQIGNGRTTSGFAFIDLVGDTTYSDYGLRLVRNNGGANTNSEIIHRGTGALNLNVTQAGSITLKTSNAERVRINPSGNVGIGTTDPATKLHVFGTASSMPSLGAAPSAAQLGGSTYGTLFSTLTSGRGVIQQGRSDGTPGSYDLLLQPVGGRVAIARTSATYTLDVGGTGRFTGDLRCLSLIQTSQRDQKKDIADIDKSKAKAIPFKEYKYKSSIDGSERKRYGVVVEDIENDYPELVHTDADGIKGINYIDLLVKRVAELEKELEDISLTPGPKGDTGATGVQGLKGDTGSTGPAGANGNDHLNNVESIAFNEKSGQLEITIKGHKDPFRFNPAK